VHSDVLPVTVVDDYAENILAQQISRYPESRRCRSAAAETAVRVQIDPTKLARSACKGGCGGRHHGRDRDAPKGSINGPKRALTIYDNDQLLKAARGTSGRGLQNGAPIRIRDIGIAWTARKTGC